MSITLARRTALSLAVAATLVAAAGPAAPGKPLPGPGACMFVCGVRSPATRAPVTVGFELQAMQAVSNKPAAMFPRHMRIACLRTALVIDSLCSKLALTSRWARFSARKVASTICGQRADLCSRYAT